MILKPRIALLVLFFGLHLLLATLLGRFFSLAPDEFGYLQTFSNLYSQTLVNPQSSSGWIMAPTSFLWIAYMPAKLMTLVGMPDFLAIRVLSAMLTTAAIALIISLHPNSKIKQKNQVINTFLIFSIPSVFLWSTLGMREPFLFFEVSLILVGYSKFNERHQNRYLFPIFLGAYGMICTKNYLWACFSISLLITILAIFFFNKNFSGALRVIIVAVLLPLAVFSATTSGYALDFLFNSSIQSAGERSGDSISEIEIPKNSSTNSGAPSKITFHGDFSLVELNRFFKDNPNSNITKISEFTGFAKYITNRFIRQSKIALEDSNATVVVDNSSLNSYVIQNASLTNPISFLVPTFLFLMGPIPFVGQPSFAIQFASLESPLWWLLYFYFIKQLWKSRNLNVFRDSGILLAAVFVIGVIAFSAIVEVNLGTSFRHRSLLVVPLAFALFKLQNKELTNKE